MDELSANFGKQSPEQDQAAEAHTIAYSEEKQLRERLSSLRQDQANNESDLHRITSKDPYPVTWQGEIQMKAAYVLVQMHRVSGSMRWIDATNRELVNELDGLRCIKITQRMRLEPLHIENLVRQMEKEDNFIALVCLLCGRSWEEIHMQTKRMSSSFVEYFKSKAVAGIVNSGPVRK
ncbi:hypothetical protein AAVH_19520 [Aphelenchoides avenae]|nr:hypothetical protein AAVH_19520 [Aphelenchus avenae]